MPKVEVTSYSIPELLEKLETGEWLAPEFQRDFVWTQNQVLGLVNSVIDAKPIGMATLWQQESKSDLPLEHISVNDWIPEIGKTGPRYYGNNEDRPGLYYAILDGKQRSTALAMAFGGLCANSKIYKNSGRYFLNVLATDSFERVSFISNKDIESQSLTSLPVYVQKGLFALEMPDTNKMMNQWVGYVNSVENIDYYLPGEVPDAKEIQRRKDVLQAAFEGLNDTRLAVYIVPKQETLGEICDIFETLNTTGTKVSTVDLIHSWLYAETADGVNPILLRENIDELGEIDGANGWASSKKRPEIIAQMLAGIQIALDKKHDPRPVSGRQITKITSIKSNDLLAISNRSWREFFEQNDKVASYLLDFQNTVSGGCFSLAQCPYPGIVTVYVALRWHLEFDNDGSRAWNVKHLNNLFRAFFWRNAFSKRYDQGFLTRVGADIADFKSFLNKVNPSENYGDWSVKAEKWLENLPQMQSKENIELELQDALQDGHVKGAIRSAAVLLLYTRARKDVVDPNEDISNLNGPLELHHVYPKDWCKNNQNAATGDYTLIDREHTNWVDSPCNLMPMSSKSNKLWKANEPSMALGELEINSEKQMELLRQYFIDDKLRDYLTKGSEGIGQFFRGRYGLLRDEIVRLMRV